MNGHMLLKIKIIKYFAPPLLLILIWFEAAVLPAGAEIVLMASLAFSFILPINYFLPLIFMVGLVSDYISAMPSGVLMASLISSVLLFLFLRRIFNLNVKSLFVNSFITLLFYEFFIWGYIKITVRFIGYRIAIDANLGDFLNNAFFAAWTFNLVGIILLAYWFGRKKAYEHSIKI